MLPNPQDYDPAYIGVDTDTWINEGVVPSGDWSDFTIWARLRKV